MICIAKESIIIGIDILPKTSVSSKPYYAVFVYDAQKEEGIESYNKASFSKLIRIVQEFKADYLVSDNVYELVERPHQIPYLCLQLLPTTKLVQITGSPIHGFTSLPKLMNDQDLFVKGKIRPLQAAEACAILASRKLGYLIEPFEDETNIIVARSRSKGPGGWSQARYGRLLDTAVKQEGLKIEDILKENNFDYDSRYARSKYGSKKVTFSVYAPIHEITKHVKKGKGKLVRIKIVPVNKERVEFIPLTQEVTKKQKLRNLIVGIDPGLTVGVSILDLNGKILVVNSHREASRGDIIRKISQYGKPSIVAVDKFPYPQYVEKIAAMLNAKLYAPRSIMTVSEKNDISRKLAVEQGVLTDDAHQRDSLAAAHKAYLYYKSDFEKIENKFFDTYGKSLRDQIKHMFVKGLSLSQAVEQIQQQLEQERDDEQPVIVVEKKEEKEKEPTIEDLSKKIELLQDRVDYEAKKNREIFAENEQLRKKIEFLQDKIFKGKSEYVRQVQRERVIQKKDDIISSQKEKIIQLNQELERFAARIDELKRVAWLRGKEGWVPLKVIKKFTKEEIERTANRYGLNANDTVLILDTGVGGETTAEMLASFNIKAILGDPSLLSYYAKNKLLEMRIPIVDIPESEDIMRIDEIAIIKEELLEELLKQAESRLEEKVTKEKENLLSNLITNYQQVRRKEIKEYDEIVQQEIKERAQYQAESSSDNED